MSATTASNLVIERLNKSYKVNGGDVIALQGIDLSIREGEFVSIVGSSGCGKSTLLRIIAGLENGYSGEVRIAGRRIAGPGLDRGMVFQEHRLIPWLTVEQNVAFGLNGLENGQRDTVVRDHLELVGLVGFLMLGPYSYLAGAISLDLGGKQGGATACGLIDGVGYLGGILAGGSVARLSVEYGWHGGFKAPAGGALLSSVGAAMFLYLQRSRVRR